MREKVPIQLSKVLRLRCYHCIALYIQFKLFSNSLSEFLTERQQQVFIKEDHLRRLLIKFDKLLHGIELGGIKLLQGTT